MRPRIKGELPKSRKGNIAELESAFQHLDAVYEKKVDEAGLRKAAQENEQNALRCRKKLEEALGDLKESDVRKTLDTLADPELAERSMDQANDERLSTSGAHGNAKQRLSELKKRLKEAEERCTGLPSRTSCPCSRRHQMSIRECLRPPRGSECPRVGRLLDHPPARARGMLRGHFCLTGIETPWPSSFGQAAGFLRKCSAPLSWLRSGTRADLRPRPYSWAIASRRQPKALGLEARTLAADSQTSSRKRSA